MKPQPNSCSAAVTTPSSSSSIHTWLPCSPLGSGSFSRVSLALNLHDGLLFAVKSTPCPSPASPSQLLAMDSELHILRSLSSPSIIRCFGADYTTQDDGSPLSRNLFLEYMEGGSLAHLLSKSACSGRLQDSLIRRCTRAIVQGLTYLHQNGIVHCDIKGQNILIGSSGIKIADFGSAKRMSAGSQVVGRVFQGTPLWMAPEVVQGVEQGFASDIWSLGCTVVEMIQGRPPWGHITNTAAALYLLGCSEENPPLPDSISEEARDFLLCCLQRDPKARWTAAQLLQHPFVCGAEAEVKVDEAAKYAQPSPRSALDFFQSELDSEDDSDWGTLSILPSPPYMAAQLQASMVTSSPSSASLKRSSTDVFIAQECDWITVKRAAGWCTEKQMPFMKSPEAGVEEVHVRRGCEVSFDTAAFLKNRKVVG